MQLKFMNWEDVEEYLKNDDRIIIPFGSTEQHGPRGVFGTDHLIADKIAVKVAEKTNTITIPVLSYGMSIHHLEFPGSISLKPSTVIKVLHDIIWSLEKGGFKRFFILNGHGGNRDTTRAALSEICNDIPDIKVKFKCWWEGEGVTEYIQELFGDREGHHSSPSEVSMTMYLYDNIIKDKTIEYKPVPEVNFNIASMQDFKKYFPNGVMGSDPNLASVEHGKNIFNKCVESISKEMDKW